MGRYLHLPMRDLSLSVAASIIRVRLERTELLFVGDMTVSGNLRHRGGLKGLVSEYPSVLSKG